MLRKITAILLAAVFAVMCLPGGNFSARADYIGNTKSKEWNFVGEINRYRLKNGLECVTTFDLLQKCADIRAEEIDAYFSHTRPDGTPCTSVLYEVGVAAAGAGENLGRAIRYKSAKNMLQGWMESPGHNWNMLQAWDHLGIGHNTARDGKTNCWCLLLIGSVGEMTGISIEGAENLKVKAGTKLKSLNIAVIEENSAYGRCGCPLIDEMCTGYNPNKTGVQTVTVRLKGMTATFDIEVISDPVEKITLDKKSASVTLKKGEDFGKSVQLTAKVAPAAAAGNVKWESSDESVATVDQNGLVTSVGFGKCTITVKSTDGTGKKASCTFNVGKKLTTSVKLTGNTKMKKGETQTISAVVKPKKAYDPNLKWKSSNPKVATVDENGVVTALKKGTVTITCTAKDGSRVKGKITIKITK